MFRVVAAASFVRAAAASRSLSWAGSTAKFAASGAGRRAPFPIAWAVAGVVDSKRLFFSSNNNGRITRRASSTGTAPGLAICSHASPICNPSNRIATLVRHMSTSAGEEAKANAVAAAGGAINDGEATIFDKIISKDIPADIIYEDDLCLAFKDINPQAPVHFLIIPKSRSGLTQLSKAVDSNKAVLGHLMFTAQKLAKEQGLEEGFRVVVNDGPQGCQTVYHLHLHVMGGRQLKWPPG